MVIFDLRGRFRFGPLINSSSTALEEKVSQVRNGQEATKERDAPGPTAADSMTFHLCARRTQLLMTLISQREMRENRLETIGQKSGFDAFGGRSYGSVLFFSAAEWMLRRWRGASKTNLAFKKRRKKNNQEASGRHGTSVWSDGRLCPRLTKNA